MLVTRKARYLLDSLFTAAICGVVVLLTFPVAAYAADGAADAGASLMSQAAPIYDAVMQGKYWYAAALGLMLLVAATRNHGADWAPRLLGWTRSDWGGPLLVVAASFAGALVTGLAAGAAPSWAMVATAFGVAGSALMSHKLLKEIAGPLLKAIGPKLPAWARPLVALALWALDKPGASAADVAKAEAAGAAAVAADPPKGAAGVVGEPTELP
jgi:hypothetical protein